jgi:Uma2 family endonuclease
VTVGIVASSLVTLPHLVLRSLDRSWDYARWEQLPYDGNRYEVLDGALYLSTVPSNFHQWIVSELVRFVVIPANKSGLGYALAGPIGVLMPGCQPAQPDLVLVRRENAGIIREGRIRGVPDLIAEILSPPSPEVDTEIKYGLYARAGVPEYWIVRPATRDILVCWEPDQASGRYTREQLFATDAQLTSPTLPLGCPVANLFAGAPDTTL